jgi:hypothetical protein
MDNDTIDYDTFTFVIELTVQVDSIPPDPSAIKSALWQHADIDGLDTEDGIGIRFLPS